MYLGHKMYLGHMAVLTIYTMLHFLVGSHACEPMQVGGRNERRESCFKMLFLFSETYFFLSVLEVTDSASLPGKQTSDE